MIYVDFKWYIKWQFTHKENNMKNIYFLHQKWKLWVELFEAATFIHVTYRDMESPYLFL